MAPKNTRFLIMSDTHADNWLPPSTPVDVAIHCGDLTEESKLHEFTHAIKLLQTVNAGLKLVIAGNHDWTLDTPQFEKKVAEARKNSIAEEDIWKEWGTYNEARELLVNADKDMVFLDEGRHEFNLKNGAKLTVFASPYTSSVHAEGAFQYTPTEGHRFDLDDTDVVITHSPPRGILDRTDDRVNAGCPHLFEAVARARPRLHCFGHIHEAWGAKLVTWRGPITGDQPLSHLTAIDGHNTAVIENLSTLHPTRFDTDESRAEKADKLATYSRRGFCETMHHPKTREQTLFVNAAIEGPREGEYQVPWIIDIELPASTGTVSVDTPHMPTTCHHSERMHNHAQAATGTEKSDSSSTAVPALTTSRKRRLSNTNPSNPLHTRQKKRCVPRCRAKPILLSFEPTCI